MRRIFAAKSYNEETKDLMIGVQDLRKGVTFELDGSLYRVLNYEHNKTGRGGATIRARASARARFFYLFEYCAIRAAMVPSALYLAIA